MKNILIHKRRVLIVAVYLLLGTMLTTDVMAQRSSSAVAMRNHHKQIKQRAAARQDIESLQAQDGNLAGNSNMMESCIAMMDMRREMETDMKTSDAELAALLTTMENADSTAKLEAMTSFVNKLTEQRREMYGKMMEHIQASGAMEDCPMMEDMMGGE